MRVLVVDDELVSRKKMKKILDGLGSCDTAESGQDALVAYVKAWKDDAPYSLITLDISMPDIDGVEILKRIRSLEQAKNLAKEEQAKIIMVTASAERDTIVQCLRSACNDYIIKPFNRETVFAKLEKTGVAVGQKETDQRTPSGEQRASSAANQ